VHAVQHGPSEVLWDEPAVLDAVETRLGEEAHSVRAEGVEVREFVLRGFADEAIRSSSRGRMPTWSWCRPLGHRSRLHWRLGSTPNGSVRRLTCRCSSSGMPSRSKSGPLDPVTYGFSSARLRQHVEGRRGMGDVAPEIRPV
jgi:hypothetical protein